jgi:hypothetical protein
MLRSRVVVAASILFVAACGAGADASAVPIAGPWQAVPFAPLDARLTDAAEAACRDMDGAGPARVQVVLHDQRGAGVDTVILAGPAFLAECDTQLRTNALVTSVGGSSAPFRGAPPPDLAVTTELGTTMSGTGVPTRTVVGGRAGAGVARVVVAVADGRQVTASLGNGFYVAWWPGADTAVSIVVSGPDGSPVATHSLP